jgi:hypothetical protein
MGREWRIFLFLAKFCGWKITKAAMVSTKMMARIKPAVV